MTNENKSNNDFADGVVDIMKTSYSLRNSKNGEHYDLKGILSAYVDFHADKISNAE